MRLVREGSVKPQGVHVQESDRVFASWIPFDNELSLAVEGVDSFDQDGVTYDYSFYLSPAEVAKVLRSVLSSAKYPELELMIGPLLPTILHFASKRVEVLDKEAIRQ